MFTFAQSAAALGALLATVSATGSPVPAVQLKTGLTIHGRTSHEASSVVEYLGIPYAAPPLAALRWAPPQPYNGTRNINATTTPPSCWQYITEHQTLLTVDAPEFMIGDAGMSEDCLTLSVWAPSNAVKAEEKLPVLIWFYGGGFATGGTDVPYQIPSKWIEGSQEHIVVVFNYRLNIFGFPTSAGLTTSQNLGLLDQRAAVEWISANIASFGGDAERLVIWGHSAGSTAVDFYNYAYPDDSLVTGMIMDSGTSHLDLLFNRDTTDFSSFSLVAANLGCGNVSDAAAELACMRAVPAAELEAFVAAYEDAGTTPSLTFIPRVDEVVVFDNYTARAANGRMADIPAIIGNTANEGMFLTTYNATDPDFAAALEYSYTYFWCPSTLTSLERLENNQTVYRHFYSGNFSNISPQFFDGAYHGSNLPLVFGTHMDFRGNSTPFEYELSHTIQDAYLAFVKDPNSGLDALGWKSYQGLGGEVMQFGDMSNMTLSHRTTLTSTEEDCRTRDLL
ncbi:unnamed protein product [Discula destructiva]